MFRLKSLVVGTIVLLGLAACSDITAPTNPSGFCPITSGSGTCDGGSVVAHK